MPRTFLVFAIACLIVAGCSGANVAAVKWNSDVSGTNVQTRCEQVDMRSKSEMDKVFLKYDGWSLIYLSEYTTSHKVGTDGVVCFERAK